jgi:hypothetical protein
MCLDEVGGAISIFCSIEKAMDLADLMDRGNEEDD